MLNRNEMKLFLCDGIEDRIGTWCLSYLKKCQIFIFNSQ